MLQISPDEFRKNQEEYMKIAAREGIQVVKNGRIIFTLSNSPAFANHLQEDGDSSSVKGAAKL
ncbi:MAG: hypothetical protein ACI4LP_01665 [Anaerovoracaceae bacterium]